MMSGQDTPREDGAAAAPDLEPGQPWRPSAGQAGAHQQAPDPLAGGPQTVAQGHVAADEQVSGGGSGPLNPGDLLAGRYRILARIGTGGMATIYRALDESLERPVAVKVLHTHLADEPELLERFRTEGRHAASLNHANIVAVYDQGVTTVPFLVMELIDGPTLRAVLRERGTLGPAAMLEVIEPVAFALDRAHRAGVVHRDIKPENVLLDAESGTPKLADFGIARVIAATRHTHTGALIGSVHYMAPELVDGADASPASDQYALGIVTFELLTGDRPFTADSPMAVALRHVRDRVPAPSTLGFEVDAAVDSVVQRATHPDPEQRFATLSAFALALRAAVPGGPERLDLAPRPPLGTATMLLPSATQATSPLDLRARDAGAAAWARPGSRLPTGSSGDPADRAPDGAADAPPSWPPDTGRLPAEAPGQAEPSTVGDADERAADLTRRARRRGITGALVLLGVLVGLSAVWATWNFVIAPAADVPELVGLTEAAAARSAEEAGFVLSVVDERHDLEVPAGRVLGQQPSPGAESRVGSEVTVTMSLGPRPVEVPNVVGFAAAQAIELLEDDRLVVDVEQVHDDEVAEGMVIRQQPAAGSDAVEGNEVTITVSLGIEQVEVPDLTGSLLDDLGDLLTDAQLVLDDEVDEDWSDEVPTEGAVIEQAPGGGEEVDRGSRVSVTVSRGPLTLAMPDLRGQGIDAARADLEERGFEVVVSASPRPRLGPFVQGTEGLVEEQLPAVGDTIRRGETVTLYTYLDGA